MSRAAYQQFVISEAGRQSRNLRVVNAGRRLHVVAIDGQNSGRISGSNCAAHHYVAINRSRPRKLTALDLNRWHGVQSSVDDGPPGRLNVGAASEVVQHPAGSNVQNPFVRYRPAVINRPAVSYRPTIVVEQGARSSVGRRL